MTRQILMNFWQEMCQHCPPYRYINNEQESILFNISYEKLPLQSNEPKVNEVNEMSKNLSVPTSLLKTDKSTQTK